MERRANESSIVERLRRYFPPPTQPTVVVEVDLLLAAADEIEALRDALTEAVEDIEHWGGYASAYFQEKWDLAGDLAKYQSVLGGPDIGSQSGPAE
jgi:hypothetical protein